MTAVRHHSLRLLLVLAFVLPASAPDAADASEPKPPAPVALRRVVILGDSITAGYGLDPSEAYPALIQAQVNNSKLPYHVVNAGVSGDTTSGGLRRIDWVLKQAADVLIIALGGNDGLRGIAPAVTQSNLCAIVDRARQRHPTIRVLVAGMQMPPSMGEEYARAYRDVFPEVARSRNTALVPFLLEGVGGRPDMNQPDLIHPTAEGQRRIAENVWGVLEKTLAER